MGKDQQTEALFRAAMSLPEAERAQLALHLLQTLPPKVQAGPDDELGLELDRRFAEWEEGRAAAVPWSDLRTGE